MKIGDVIDMDMKFCNRVLKFKLAHSKTCPADAFSVPTEQIVINFQYMIETDTKFCKKV